MCQTCLPCRLHVGTVKGPQPERSSQSDRDCEADLDRAVRPFARNLARYGVNHHAERLPAIPICQQPDGEQQMFEGDRTVVRLLRRDLLDIATDSLSNLRSQRRFDPLTRRREAVFQIHVVGASEEPRQQLLCERHALRQRPRFESLHE